MAEVGSGDSFPKPPPPKPTFRKAVSDSIALAAEKIRWGAADALAAAAQTPGKIRDTAADALTTATELRDAAAYYLPDLANRIDPRLQVSVGKSFSEQKLSGLNDKQLSHLAYEFRSVLATPTEKPYSAAALRTHVSEYDKILQERLRRNDAAHDYEETREMGRKWLREGAGEESFVREVFHVAQEALWDRNEAHSLTPSDFEEYAALIRELDERRISSSQTPEAAGASLSAEKQIATFREMASNEVGIRNLALRFISGQLSSFLPLHVERPNSYRGSGADEARITEHRANYSLVGNSKQALPNKVLAFEAYRELDEEGRFRVTTTSYPTGLREHVSMETDYRFLDKQPKPEVMQGRTVITLALTAKNKPSSDVAIIINRDGSIRDVLPFNDFAAEESSGPLFRETAAAKETASPADREIIEAMEAKYQPRIRAALKEGRMAHERGGEEYDLELKVLQSKVASLFGLTPEQLLASKVDVKATFEALINQPLHVRTALEGTGIIANPPIVFTS